VNDNKVIPVLEEEFIICLGRSLKDVFLEPCRCEAWGGKEDGFGGLEVYISEHSVESFLEEAGKALEQLLNGCLTSEMSAIFANLVMV